MQESLEAMKASFLTSLTWAEGDNFTYSPDILLKSFFLFEKDISSEVKGNRQELLLFLMGIGLSGRGILVDDARATLRGEVANL